MTENDSVVTPWRFIDDLLTSHYWITALKIMGLRWIDSRFNSSCDSLCESLKTSMTLGSIHESNPQWIAHDSLFLSISLSYFLIFQNVMDRRYSGCAGNGERPRNK